MITRRGRGSAFTVHRGRRPTAHIEAVCRRPGRQSPIQDGGEHGGSTDVDSLLPVSKVRRRSAARSGKSAGLSPLGLFQLGTITAGDLLELCRVVAVPLAQLRGRGHIPSPLVECCPRLRHATRPYRSTRSRTPLVSSARPTPGIPAPPPSWPRSQPSRRSRQRQTPNTRKRKQRSEQRF